MRYMLAALALIALPACVGIPVKTELDLTTDFSRYHTYAWIEGAPGRDSSLESQAHEAVDRELPFKQLQRVETSGTPDLYVTLCVTGEEGRVVRPDQWGYDLGPAAGTGGSHADALTFLPGTLLIDLVDSGSRKLVWRGQVSKTIDRRDPEETIRRAVREIFRYYPPDKSNAQEETTEVVLSRPKRWKPIDK